MKMSESTEAVGGILLAIIFVGAVAYGSWRVERWLNWKFGYSKDVSSEVVPLEKRIDELEQRIKELENK